MPELPEVEVVRRGLAPHVLGRRITSLEIHEPRSVRRQDGGAAALIAQLEGARVTALVRRGKYLWWRVDAPVPGVVHGHAVLALMTHLGMSGQLRLRDGAATSRHRRASLHLEDGAVVDFMDQRLFGGLWTSPLVPAPDGLPAGEGSPDHLLPLAAAHIARDVLDPAVDVAERARMLRSRRAGIKSLLLAQDIVSGIGNIYADEALWAARAHHDTPGSALSQVRARRILTECREVMTRALAAGGTSFDALYVNVDGRSGAFARSLAAYGREGRPCPRCGTPIRRVQRQGRSCFSCPRCQRVVRTLGETTKGTA